MQKSPYLAQLKVFLESGTKTVATLMEAAPTLEDMGIYIEENEMEDFRG